MEALLYFLNSIFPLSDGLKDHLLQILKHRELHKKDYLLKAGKVSKSICFIKKGLLRCFSLKDDKEVSSWFMKEGDIILSVNSFFTQTPSHESIQALEDSELFCISYDELEHIYRAYPEFNFIARVVIQKYYAQSEQRLYSLRMQRSNERYEFLLEHYPELILRVPAKYIASYLGMTEVYLSSLKGKG